MIWMNTFSQITYRFISLKHNVVMSVNGKLKKKIGMKKIIKNKNRMRCQTKCI